jgi:hypothetical protein
LANHTIQNRKMVITGQLMIQLIIATNWIWMSKKIGLKSPILFSQCNAVCIFFDRMYCKPIMIDSPSLNTQSCIKGLLVVQDFCFWAVWAAKPALKNKVWADYEQLLRAFFSCFQGQKKGFFQYCSTKKLYKMKLTFFLST